MSYARVANRMRRAGRNPGGRHLAGVDVTAKMQRQYEHILEGFRRTGRYRTDSKRKQVAAATVRKLRHNPDSEALAEKIASGFHGRPVREFIDYDEVEIYSEYGGILGELMRLDILVGDDEAQSIEFDFRQGARDNIMVVAPDTHNIEFVGGDQDFDWRKIDGATQSDKNLVLVGPVCEIDYFADKHHLSGPKEQKHGITYFHEFGDEGGELPCLLFDSRNKKLLFAGGDYTIEPEGITG